jgi:perosamine synthetase
MKLAINGGKKIRYKKFPRYNLIDEKEIEIITNVLKRGVLSKFLGCWDKDFYGGDEIQSFEKEWSEHFKIKHTVSVNSASSGLHIALGACGIGFNDEVIVTPYSMSVSATAPLLWNATPVFADINKNSLCLDVKSIEKKITKNTKAIIVVHLFGYPAEMDEIMNIAKKYNLFVIEDAAQAPDAIYKGKKVGTIGDIGVFSLNYHKHIHTGEGGMCVTNSDELATRMQLIRNHAESVIEDMNYDRLDNMLGFNFRLTEIQAAIGRIQLKKLKDEVDIRNKYAKKYNEALKTIDFIEIIQNSSNRLHSFYVQGFLFNEKKAGISRKKYLDAVRAELEVVEGRENEGVPIYEGYSKPLYLLPLFQKRQVYKDVGFAFKNNISYSKGICPVVEKLYEKELFFHDFTRSPLNEKDIEDVINAYIKVSENIDELK